MAYQVHNESCALSDKRSHKLVPDFDFIMFKLRSGAGAAGSIIEPKDHPDLPTALAVRSSGDRWPAFTHIAAICLIVSETGKKIVDSIGPHQHRFLPLALTGETKSITEPLFLMINNSRIQAVKLDKSDTTICQRPPETINGQVLIFPRSLSFGRSENTVVCSDRIANQSIWMGPTFELGSYLFCTNAFHAACMNIDHGLRFLALKEEPAEASDQF